MRDTRVETWEDRLQRALDAVDVALEARHGTRYPLHPARPPHGQAARRQYDGLFQLSAAFTAGFGSRHGRGYDIEVRVATLASIPATERKALVSEAVDLLRGELERAFPGRKLEIVREGTQVKLVGDLAFS